MLAQAGWRAGMLVFGGGHVVLPLLEAGTVPRLVEETEFLAGYGLAQAIPGPLFSLAAYVGAASAEGPGEAALRAGLGAAAIFAPGFLMLAAALPVWARLEASARLRAGLAGAGAAVTGVLAAALVDPVLTAVPHGLAGYGLALGAFAALRGLKAPPPFVVAACAGLGAVLI